MAEDRIKWTKQQRRAIDARGSDVLVTASAGTGKTAVLSGRCVDLVSEKAQRNVREMLILTFTEMAAEQMRSRIGDRLRDEYARTRDAHLRRQIVMLPAADISTIHSFCKRLITEYFHKLGLNPTFSVLDGDEAKLLKADVLDKAIDSIWRQGDAENLQKLLRRRDLRANDGFLGKVIELSDFLDGVVSREQWCERAIRLAEELDPAAGELGRKQKDIIAGKLRRVMEHLRYVHRLYENESPGGEWGGKFERGFIEPVARCLDLLKADDWNEFAESITGFKKPTFNKPKDVPKSLAELMHESTTSAFKAFRKVSSLAVLSPDYVEKVGKPVASQTRVLVELVSKFDELYSRAKLSLNCLDFSDLEHKALELLTETATEETLTPTATALALRERYKYIFVDEYQDINPVQQAILDALSSGDNLFVVGDVKQSIYSWRGAEPTIFLDRLSESGDASGGFRVDLNANFRSKSGILEFVNKIFRRIMTESFANIDYDESAELKSGLAEESAPEEPLVEFHVLDEKSKDDTDADKEVSEADGDESPDIVTSRRRQAAMIARRIKKIVGAETGRSEFQIYDKDEDCMRDVDYSDIVILLRSLAHTAKDYVEVLRLAGVPVSCEATAGYFEATEITDMLCLLKVLDNPQRDIELAGILRSPFFGVTDSELAKIRLHGGSEEKGMGFYTRVLEYSKSGADADLAARLADILAKIDEWRTSGRRGSIADMIWRIYRSTNYLSFVSALPSGQARRANLLKLHERAIQFEGFVAAAGMPSLRRFVEFIEKLQETGQDWAPAEPASSAGRAVRILSVHKSKGLEFPIVFLAELQSKFNLRDVSADCLADAGDTLGLQIIDAASNSKLRSAAHQIIAEKKRWISLAEEMRILYVALTRAENRLILTAAQKHDTCAKTLTSGFYLKDAPLPDWVLAGCVRPLDWILRGLADQQLLHEAFETGLAKKCRDDNVLTFAFHNQTELARLSEFVTNLKKTKSIPKRARRKKSGKSIINNQLSIINESIAWQYAFGDAPALPAKSSVSQLTHRSDEYFKSDYSKAFDRRPAVLAAADETKPIDPRLRGTATHLLISSLNLPGAVTMDTIERAKEDLVGSGAIAPAVVERIDTDSILTFFQTDIGRLALDPANKVHQEWPFTLAFPASEWKSPEDRGRTTDGGRRTTDDRGQRTGDGRRTMDNGWQPQAELGDGQQSKTGGSLKPALSEVEGRSLGMAETTSDIRHPTSDVRDTIIIQGMIDLLIQTPEGLVVVDFKTDKVSAAGAAERAELYRPQLDAYTRAAASILKADSATKHVYFLTPELMIDL
ncbi:MAG: helicase-exonuclease AddAB subunit AddA [Planctomycetota bacterium]|jgi:ATP-dependent helicase/nuclease subunit A